MQRIREKAIEARYAEQAAAFRPAPKPAPSAIKAALDCVDRHVTEIPDILTRALILNNTKAARAELAGLRAERDGYRELAQLYGGHTQDKPSQNAQRLIPTLKPAAAQEAQP